MPPIFMKPETVLKRSEELLALGTPQSQQQGLEVLMEVFQTKRFKTTPLPVLEPIILKFLELCTTLRKPRLARDGLGLYKLASQQVSIPSLEKVLLTFIKGAEDKLAEAQEEAKKVLGDSIVEDGNGQSHISVGGVEDDDLELPLQPYTLLVDSLLNEPTSESDIIANANGGVVSTADRERVERAIVTPWMRFCWEAYKSCLEVAKSNSRLEVIYQNISLQAFKFCRIHSRKSEFRRLCEQLRKDLLNAQKYSHQTHAINFSDVETLTRHLDTRFSQLETAVELELWQEAFRSVEDIHGLLVIPAAKKATKPAMMANYYEKLTRIFKAEGASANGTMAVFHAAAWGRYLQFAEREMETRSKKEVAAAAAAPAPAVSNEKAPGCVLLSALAVPLGGGEAADGKNGQRLVALLNLQKMPTRQSLLRDVINKNVLRRVPAQLRDLYTLIETDFHPLTACESIAPLVSSLAADADYAPYLSGLRDVVLSRLLQALSKLYSSIQIEHVLDLVGAFKGTPWETSEKDLEKFLMATCKRGELSVSVDHVAKAVTFQEDAFDNPMPFTEITNLQVSGSIIDDSPLARLASALQNTIYYLDPSQAEAARQAKAEAFAQAIAHAEEERKAIQHRQAIIARRRQKMEEINTRREKEEAIAKAEKARVAAEEAQKREAELFAQRERDRLQKQIDAVKAEEAKKLADTLKARGGLKVDVENMEVLDTEKLLQLQSKQIEKEQREVAERLRIIAKRVDHLERAFRKEERPLIEADYDLQKAEDLKAHVAAFNLARQAAKEKHAIDLDLKKRLGRMMSDYLQARSVVESKRADEFTKRKADTEKKLAEEKAKLRKRVLAERAAEKKRAAEEEARRAEEEALAAAQSAAAAKAEEEERAAEAAKEAEREAKRAARAAEKAADMELIAKQRAREEEAEKRRQEKDAAARGVPAGGMRSGLDRPSAATPSAGERPRLNLAKRSVEPSAAAAASAAAPAPTRAAEAPAASAPAPFRAAGATGATGAAVPTWREREAARKAAEAAGGAAPQSSALPSAVNGASTGGTYRPRGAGGPGFGGGASGGASGGANGGAGGGAWRRTGA